MFNFITYNPLDAKFLFNELVRHSLDSVFWAQLKLCISLFDLITTLIQTPPPLSIHLPPQQTMSRMFGFGESCTFVDLELTIHTFGDHNLGSMSWSSDKFFRQGSMWENRNLQNWAMNHVFFLSNFQKSFSFSSKLCFALLYYTN